MARPRSPNRDKAKELWLKSGKRRLLKDIADELQVSEEQVRKWKNQDKWDKVTLPNGNSNVTNRRGGQPGNKNATGGPVGNKKAVKTGEFETLFFDCLNEDEKKLAETVPIDKEQLLKQEIQLLTVREQRMLKRIEHLKELEKKSQEVEDTENEKEFGKQPTGMVVTKYASGIERGQLTLLKECEGILGQIQNIEDALTRVQARKQKAIDSLHRYGFDDARLEIATLKLELEMLKMDASTEEQQDDGFINAMNAAVEDVWGDVDE